MFSCPAFGKGMCPYAILVTKCKGLAGNCPAFKDGCPFKNCKSVVEFVEKLTQMRDQMKDSTKGKRLRRRFSVSFSQSPQLRSKSWVSVLSTPMSALSAMMLKESLSVTPSKMARPGEVDKHGFHESKLVTRTDDILVVLMYIVSVVSYFSHLIKRGLGLFFELLE